MAMLLGLRLQLATRVGRLAAARGVRPLAGRVSYDMSMPRAALATASADKVTPMVQQYLERKKAYPDCMLLFQVGDFYEFFGEDARRASTLLSLALTRKSKQTSAFEDMCGFPMASLDSYVEKLVMHHGVKVAICNQVESASTARQRGHKTLVDRQVVRIITPGSLVEDAMLSPAENNYLAAVYASPSSNLWGVAWADVSTGEFVSTSATSDRLASTLVRCSPKEVLIPESWLLESEANSSQENEWLRQLAEALPSSCMKTYRPLSCFNAPTKTRDNRETEQSAAAAIVDYVAFTQQSNATSLRVREPQHLESSDHMIIDPSAWRSLEIAKSLAGTKQSSLLQCVDDTITPSGSRLLASHLASPLTNIKLLNRRLDCVSYFVANERILKRVRKQLVQVSDVERSIQRLSAGAGTPKDLQSIAVTIAEAKELARILGKEEESKFGHIGPLPDLLSSICADLFVESGDERSGMDQLAARILAALSDDGTALNTKSGFVKEGYDKTLDKWRSILNVGPQISQKDALQQKYRRLVGSTRLRVGYQTERGFFIDVPHEESSKLMEAAMNSGSPSDLDGLDMIQSLKNFARFRTNELKELNRELMEATQEIARIELKIFDSLRDAVLRVAPTLQLMARAIAQLDVIGSHAQIALERNFSRPVLDASTELHIEDGRHAVVEAAHLQGKNSKYGTRAFVPNSLHLVPTDENKNVELPQGACWLLTGPNMGGKSTFLRQNAQLVILAQSGSYVPARFARVGIVDKLFCRVGSADDLASDKSTFLVEMQETATILTQATSRSFVLMDEVGRGTAVNDGVAIAGAVLEALCEKQIRVLFATHFTALGTLVAEKHRREMQMHRMEVLERRRTGPDQATMTQLVFTHRVVQGLAPHSYGIHTAALAGCPSTVVDRAAQLLEQLK